MRTKEDALKALRAVDAKTITEVQKQAMLKFQISVEDFTHDLFENVPECADRTAAFRKLLECKMTCIQAITHTGFDKPKEAKNGKEEDKEKNSNQKES